MSRSTFSETLVEELVENKYDLISRRSARAPEANQNSDTKSVAGARTHLAATNKKRKLSNGDVSNVALQGICPVFKVSWSTIFDSTCRDSGVVDIHICHVSTTWRRCCTLRREKIQLYLV